MIDEKKLIEELKERNYQLVFSINDQYILNKVIKIIKEQQKIGLAYMNLPKPYKG